MKKIIVSLFVFAFLFAGQLMAAPMQAYYCFNTQQPEVIIEAFDENFDALALSLIHISEPTRPY